MTSRPDDTQNLAPRYAQMSNEELQLISSQQSDLTEAARTALRAELERRGMAQALEGTAGPPGYDEVEFQNLVTVRRFRELSEALIAKGSLESAGIECYLVDDNMVRIFVSTFTGGVRLQVKPDDLAAATEILNAPPPPDVEGDETTPSSER
ncbi:MAG TPA: DUF2007 domain-containing protein [Terriglobales bacterium]|nr:DUF2007 domain-containing protein [Terriglobales bacterium]